MSTGAPADPPGAGEARPWHRRFALTPSLDEVSRTTAQIQALPRCLPEQEWHAVQVAVAEVLTNIVKHGYAGGGPGRVELVWIVQPGWLDIDVRDAGQPIPRDRLRQAGPTDFDFDPTDFQSLPQSGLGLALIKGAFDHYEYASRGGVNRLRLRKFFLPGPATATVDRGQPR